MLQRFASWSKFLKICDIIKGFSELKFKFKFNLFTIKYFTNKNIANNAHGEESHE